MVTSKPTGPISLDLPNVSGITCHSWNKDRTLLALSPNNETIQIYNIDGAKLSLHTTLKGHNGLVTGLDWGHNANRLASCGQDRNVFIWEPDTLNWKSTLVVTRLSRAATCIQWSPKENKIAIGSSENIVAICYRDTEENFWKTKHLDKQRLSTHCVSWHPNNVLLATGGIDQQARVVSAYIKNLDEKPLSNPWGDRLPFGTLCAEFSGEGWIQAISFSPSGNTLAWSCSTRKNDKQSQTLIHIAQPSTSLLATLTLSSVFPFKQILFLKESQLIVGGYGYHLYLFESSSDSISSWKCIGRWSGSKNNPSSMHSDDNVFERFKKLDTRGQAFSYDDDSSTTNSKASPTTAHHHPISCIRVYSTKNNTISMISTSALDGKVLLWSVFEKTDNSCSSCSLSTSKLLNKAPKEAATM